MLALDACGRDHCRFVFADTGHEHEATYEYVNSYLPTVLGPIDTVHAEFSREIANKRVYVETIWPTKGACANRAACVERTTSVRSPVSGTVPGEGALSESCRNSARNFSNAFRSITICWRRWLMIGRLRVGAGFVATKACVDGAALERELVAAGYWIVQPIATWTAPRVIAFVAGRGVKLNPLYEQGMYRIGCMPCIHCNKNELLQISKRFVQHIDPIREWERLVSLAAKRGWTTFFSDSFQEGETSEEIFERMHIAERVRGGKPPAAAGSWISSDGRRHPRVARCTAYASNHLLLRARHGETPATRVGARLRASQATAASCDA